MTKEEFNNLDLCVTCANSGCGTHMCGELYIHNLTYYTIGVDSGIVCSDKKGIIKKCLKYEKENENAIHD